VTTGSLPPGPPVNDPAIAERMRAMAAGLTAAGFTVHLHNTKGVLDIAAVYPRHGGRDIKVIIDEDGYTEIRYWNSSQAPPDEVTGLIRALTRQIP
jgi:hypothetical protein